MKMKNTMKKPVNIPVSKLRPFEGHPFKVKDDEEMNTLIESVQTQGILSPLIVRPIENTDEYTGRPIRPPRSIFCTILSICRFLE